MDNPTITPEMREALTQNEGFVQLEGEPGEVIYLVRMDARDEKTSPEEDAIIREKLAEADADIEKYGFAPLNIADIKRRGYERLQKKSQA